VRAAVLRYRVMAYVTGVVLVVLVFGRPSRSRWRGTRPWPTTSAWCTASCTSSTWCAPGLLARGLRLGAKPTLIMLLAGTVPIMTFIVERWVTRRFINPALGEGVRPVPAGRAGQPGPPGKAGDGPLLLRPARLPAPARPGPGDLARRIPGSGHRRRGVLPRPAGPGHPPAARGGSPRRRPAVTCWTWAAATDRSPACWPPGSPSAAVWAVDVNERALELCARNARDGGPGQRALPDPRRCRAAGQVRRDLVQPAGPHRQGGSARAAIRLAGPAGAGRPTPTWWSGAIWAPTRCNRWLAGQGWP